MHSSLQHLRHPTDSILHLLGVLLFWDVDLALCLALEQQRSSYHGLAQRCFIVLTILLGTGYTPYTSKPFCMLDEDGPSLINGQWKMIGILFWLMAAAQDKLPIYFWLLTT